MVECEIYGVNSVKQVMNGGHYSRSKRGLSLIAESLHVFRLIVSVENSLIALQKIFTDGNVKHPAIHCNAWKECQDLVFDSKF